MTSTINGDEDFLMSDTTTEHGAAAGDPGGDQQAERVPYRYTARMAGEIEAFWQDRWEKEGTFEAPNPAGPMAEPEKIGHRPKLYVMDMFPYPSGAGLHVGHPLGYVATDCYARYKWMTGHNVLHTMGFDAFGLPAEQYAVQTGRHPRITTEQNIEGYRAQLRRLGLGHDRRRSIATIDPAYYRWTQWIFLQIFNSWYDEDQDKARPIAGLIADARLRGTAVTRLAIVGCTVAEIATITGHSLRDVHSILDSNYLSRDPALGESAIRKLERGV